MKIRDTESQALVDTIVETGQLAMRECVRDKQNVTVKANDTTVTAADLAVDQFFCNALKKIFPTTPIVTEVIFPH